MSDILTEDKFISIEDLIERIVKAVDLGEPFALARWGDGENRVLSEARQGAGVLQHVGNRLTLTHYDEFRQAYAEGTKAADVLGFYVGDTWTTNVLAGLQWEWIAEKDFIYAWCNRHWNARREWVNEVLGRQWRVALVGNRMPEYRVWLEARYQNLSIVQCDTAPDWPQVKAAMERLAETRPQLVLASAGWFAACIAGAAKAAGAVALDYGHCPDYHMAGRMLPNTCCPQGPAGTAQHYAHKVVVGGQEQGLFADAIHQEREIEFPWRQTA